MNILVLSWRDIKHPLAGGAEQVMHEHAKAWVRAGHKVTHFSSKLNGLLDSEAIDGIQFKRSGYQYLGVQVAGFFYYLKNRKEIDFVVDEFHGIPFFTPLYVRKPKIAVIQEIARNVWFLNPLHWPMNWLIGLAGFLSEPFVFLFYKKMPFITASISAKADVTKMGINANNITVIPHGVRLEGGRWKLEGGKSKIKTIIYLGVLSKDKGIEDAIKCFAILNKAGQFNFWVIGKPETKDYGQKIKQLVAKLGLSGKVKFWGFVPQDKKFELLSKAHVLVNPSVHEGWGLVNIEANSMGVPVVAYHSAGLIDSVKDNFSGIVCKKNMPEELAKKILEIFNDETKYKNLKRGAFLWSQNFSWEKSGKLSVKLIKKISNEF